MTRHILLTLAVAATLFCGCKQDPSHSGEADSNRKELWLYCGAGLRPVADDLIAVFEQNHNVKVAADYAGSEVLLSKIRLVRKGDLYMPGDIHYIDLAAREDMILSQNPVCYFVPTILVQKGNPKGIHTLADLLKPGIKVGLGDPKACAIGRKTMQILTKNDIAWKDLEKNVSFQSLTVNELGLQIQAKALDAVIVWDAIAKYYLEVGEEISIPASMNVISTVAIGVLKYTKHGSLSDDFLQFAGSEQGKAIFRKHLYSVELPR